MKNKPPIASGCLKNVLMPDLTHAMPVRAGTTLSEIADAETIEGKFEDDMKSLIFKQTELIKLIRMRHALLQYPLKMLWVMRFEHAGFAR
jgi:hypothetical protein